MKYLQNTPHLDPLPSSDEGRGNPAVFVKRTPVCACERSACFPLPFGKGEDQGEALLWKTYVSLTKWKWGRGEGEQDIRQHKDVAIQRRRGLLRERPTGVRARLRRFSGGSPTAWL